jgi:hypothetical protein
MLKLFLFYLILHADCVKGLEFDDFCLIIIDIEDIDLPRSPTCLELLISILKDVFLNLLIYLQCLLPTEPSWDLLGHKLFDPQNKSEISAG